MAQIIETSSFAIAMRDKIIRAASREILIAELRGSDQEQDLTVPANCGGVGRIRHFRRATSPGWPQNPLPIDPASRALGLPRTDDLRAQVFQNAACAWRCWYCYVPFSLLSGDAGRGRWMTADALVELYSQENDAPIVIDLSGGSPDLTPEWISWMMRSLQAAGLSEKTYLWSDDNLSTDYLFSMASEDDRRTIVSYRNYGRVCCIKGFDAKSFSFNTTAEPAGFDRQFGVLRKYLSLNFDVYGYITLTGDDLSSVDDKVPALVDRLQAINENLPLRVIPLEIANFTPTDMRAKGDLAKFAKADEVQQKAIGVWTRELERRFTKAERAQNIADVSIGRRP